MRIVVQDFAALPPPVLGEAKTVVTRIYSQIGGDIAWRNIGRRAPSSSSTWACSQPKWNAGPGLTGARSE